MNKKNGRSVAANRISPAHSIEASRTLSKPAYAHHFDPAQSRYGECCRVFIGSWRAASGLNRIGYRSALCVPPAHDPLQLDWSLLRGQHVLAWIYCAVDARRFAATLRAAGALDISIFDRRTNRFVVDAFTPETARTIDSIRKESRP